MNKYNILLRKNSCIIAFLICNIPVISFAQSNSNITEDADPIVVTGSFIRGTSENAALPVDVYRADTLAENGISTPLEFIKDLPQIGGVFGDTNQFATAAQNNQAFGSINLRGLGANRTLVLFNGRRTLTAPGAISGGFGDTNAIPLFALDRIEILKDGAAATYGSDAIAGVANFITKTAFEGAEIKADNEFIAGSDGNRTASILLGRKFGAAHIIAGIGWQHRSELATTEREFGFQPYSVNPSAYSGLGNPGFYNIPGLGNRVDVGCAELGGTPDGICRFSFVPFTNLVEEENRYQGYIQADVDLNNNLRFHGEFTYAQTDLDAGAVSPSFPPLQGPAGARLGGGFTVAPNNPGLAIFARQLGIAAPTTPVTAVLWRPLGSLGNPADPSGRGAGRQTANNRGYRLSGGFENDFSDRLSGQLYLTWANYERRRSSPDFIGSRLQDALNGLGGPNCNPATGTPGVGGCLWFNPFTNAGPGNPALGLTNPFYVPGNENDPDLIRYLQVANGVEETEETFIADLLFSGDFAFDIGGGPIRWAAGGQYRNIALLSRTLNAFSDLNVNPCLTLGDRSCAGGALDGAGSFVFLGGNRPESLDQDSQALFAEINIPVSSRLEITAAARFETYGGPVGSTFNPKGAISWKPSDWFTLRGSVGTTFRAPLASQVSPNAITTLAGITAASGNFRAIDTAGNPDTLGPETAFSYNIGAALNFGGFRISADYWSFDFENEITTTDAQAIASNVVPVAGGLANCASPFAALIRFDGGGCVQGTTTGLAISRIASQWVNGPQTKTSGLDFAASYEREIGPGQASIGINASHVLTYRVGDFFLNGILLRRGFDAVGLANLDRSPGSISPWRGNGFIQYKIGGLNLRYGVKYVDGVRDERCDGREFCATTNFGGTNFGRIITSFTQHDFHSSYNLPFAAFKAQLQFSVENFSDVQAPDARIPLGYNPFIGNPLGRVYRLGVTAGF